MDGTTKATLSRNTNHNSNPNAVMKQDGKNANLYAEKDMVKVINRQFSGKIYFDADKFPKIILEGCFITNINIQDKVKINS